MPYIPWKVLRAFFFLAGKRSEDVFPSISFTATSPKDPSKEIIVTLASSALREVLHYAPTDGLPSQGVDRVITRVHAQTRGEDGDDDRGGRITRRWV